MNDDLEHGGALDVMRRQFPLARTPWIDLSTGVNPWPYSGVQMDMKALAQLPQRAENEDCRAAMATAWNAPIESIVLAPGSELLIRLLPTVLVAKRVAILSPTYGDHLRAWSQTGAEIVQTNDPLALVDSVDLVVLSNPNNPDGRTFAASDLREARARLVRRGGWLIVDEAYVDLDPTLSLAAEGGTDGLILLRSFGKFFGLPGLRLGALIAPATVRNAMVERLGVWPVSSTALVLGAAAYRDLDWQAETRSRLAIARKRLDELWVCSGHRSVGGTSLFGYFQVGNANAAWKRLAQQGVYVRRFNWSECTLRVGLARNADEESRLEEALTFSM